ncbi:class I SAM-dependent RNA methyltransferase [Magnetovibrio sp. PR-2]|uniref:class I SAM-dependent RNA methyltransferase n=1 Tax=Magnetovibrio sp. PR-2 TaxID=3120356 RepID=UPI002FCE5C96
MSRRPKKHRGRKRTAPKLVREQLDVSVQSLGAQGDGIAHAEFQGKLQQLYIPGALPGESVRVETRAKRGEGVLCQLLDIASKSEDRKDAACPHFDTCGGCALQHLTDQAYGAWKQARVVEALQKRGFDTVPVSAPIRIGEGTRRRVTFTALKRGKKLFFGFNARASHDLVAVENCPLLVAELNALIAPMQAAFGAFLQDGARARIHVTDCENGADILIECDQTPDLAAREALAAFVQSCETARIGWKQDGQSPEPIVQAATPLIDLSGVKVELPQGAFLQASVVGEHAIRDAVLAGLEGVSGRFADLFCGLGSFSVPLSRQGRVDAFDVTEASLKALERGAGRADLGGRISAHVRDLGNNPLVGKELCVFDAVVFDPPRAGALDQAQQLAEADVQHVVGVSCNPATFARDARVLVDGGFQLISVQPIDQFTYSPHVELVAQFRR